MGLVRLCLAALGCLACNWALAHAQPAPSGQAGAPVVAPAVVSPDAYIVQRHIADVDLRSHVWEWIDPTGAMTLEQVLAAEQSGQAKFLTSASQPRVKHLENKRALWLRFRLNYPADVVDDHVIYIPQPYLDEVTFFVREPTGAWSKHIAGDTVAIDKWPERTRYPVLRLHPTPGQERLVYLRIHQGTRMAIPVMLEESAHFNWDERFEMLVFGGVTGGLVLLTLVCLLQGVVFRDRDFLHLAGFSLLMTFGLATYMGVTPLVVGGRTDIWADVSQAVMFCLIASAGLFLVRLVLQGSAVRPRFLVLLRVAAWLGVPLAVFAALAPRPIVAGVIAAYVLVTTSVSIWACVAAWRVRAKAAWWLTLAFVPMVLAVVVLSARLLGVDMPLWLESHALTLGTALHLPLMVMAMNMRARDKHMAHARTLALETQDALTGLLASHLFEDRVSRALRWNQGRKASGAVVLMKIGNFHRLRAAMGAPAADQLLLRATVRMRRVIANSDNLARLGEAEFGALLESETERAAVQEVCARLVAVGLMPLKGLPKGISLNFQCVVLMLSESKHASIELLHTMRVELGKVSSRTRRPIRFLDSGNATSSEPSHDLHAAHAAALGLPTGQAVTSLGVYADSDVLDGPDEVVIPGGDTLPGATEGSSNVAQFPTRRA